MYVAHIVHVLYAVWIYNCWKNVWTMSEGEKGHLCVDYSAHTVG